MPRTNKTLTNIVGGELSPLMYGRIDLPVFQKGLLRCENFIIQPQGGGRFRPGTTYVHHTRGNKDAVLIPFQFNDSQSYVIEATEKKFRFYKDNSIITEDPKNISAVASFGSETYIVITAHGFSSGDEVYIEGIVGPKTLNKKFYVVEKITDDVFCIKDTWLYPINSNGLPPYTSGGTAARIYELTTPYYEVDLPYLQYAQNADTMYIANPRYAPGKLTRTGHAAWTITDQTRTDDPFTPTDLNTLGDISAITQANPGVFTHSANHTLVTGQEIYMTGIAGMTELNNRFYTVVKISDTTFSLKTSPGGEAVDTTSYTAYVQDGNAQWVVTDEYPRAVAFSDTGRLMYGGTQKNPESIWTSKAPSSGTTQYDDFTTGTDATDGIRITLAPIHGKVDAIQWMTSTSKFIVIGTFGSIRILYGGTEDQAISPSSVTAKSLNSVGAAYTLPISNGNSLFYIQRGSKLLRSLEYDIAVDSYATTDRNLVSEHLSNPGMRQMVVQQTTPDVAWVARNDGFLIGLTFKEKEDISGWHKHWLGGEHVDVNGKNRDFAKVLWCAPMPRTSGGDQLWMIVERNIGGRTYRSVEYMNDFPMYPISDDFVNAPDGDETADTIRYENRLYEVQKDAIHLDMALTYDGSETGTTLTIPSGATLEFLSQTNGTPKGMLLSITEEQESDPLDFVTRGSPIGLTLVFTHETRFRTSSAYFESDMVGREIWEYYDVNGNGGGRARITQYISSTEVACEVLVPFYSNDVLLAGEWYLTTDEVSGLEHLEGQQVSVVVDGATHPVRTVVNGSITLDAQSSKVHVGLPYTGVIKTLNLDTGGMTGSAQHKMRNAVEMAIRFMNTVGTKFGTDYYMMEDINFRSMPILTGRGTLPVSAVMRQAYLDRWEEDEKHGLVIQNVPMPCNVLSWDFFMETTDE